MKIYAISDLHLSVDGEKPMDIFGYSWENYIEEITKDWKEKVGDEDIVLLAGDLCWAMKTEDVKGTMEFLSSLPGIKIIIKGNHDYWWGSLTAVRSVLPKDVHAIQNDALKIGSFIFCGTRGWVLPERIPLTPDDEKILQREIIRLELSLKQAEKLKTNNEKIIALMHYPPFNSRREECEFTKLFEKFGVHSVVYGHLHGDKVRADKVIDKNGVKYYLTSCDQVSNKLVLINVD